MIGAFAHGNPVRFHDGSGSGYRFKADHMIKLDELNPQVAAHLATAFNSWKRYDEGRRENIREPLPRLLARPGISSDVEEIVTRALT